MVGLRKFSLLGIVCQRKCDEAKTNNVGKEIRKLSTIRSDHSSWQRGDQEKVHFKHNLSQSSQQQSTNLDGKQGLCARYYLASVGFLGLSPDC